MKKSKFKTLTAASIAWLMIFSSFAIVIPIVQAAVIERTVVAFTVLPNPGTIGEASVVTAVLRPVPPEGHFYTGSFDVTDPSGATATYEPFVSNEYGALTLPIYPDQMGTYTIRVYGDSQEINEDTYTAFDVGGLRLIVGEAYQLTIEVDGQGDTIPPPGSYIYEPSEQVVVEAIPETGWEFDYWILDEVNVGAFNPYTVTMDTDHTLTAFFSEEGPPGYIPPGEDVGVSPDPQVSLVFDYVEEAGYATATQTNRYPPLPPLPEIKALSAATQSDGNADYAWEIIVTATFEGRVIVGIDYSDFGTVFQLLQTDIILGDVNADGIVNRYDLLIIIRALFTTPNSRRWNPYCDLNNDDRVSLGDLGIALRNYGETSVWEDITMEIDEINQIIYGETDHFSLFRCR